MGKEYRREEHRVCTGEDDRFGPDKGDSGPCRFYIGENQCQAVEEKWLADTFDDGRCLIVLYDFVDEATRRYMRAYPGPYSDKKESEDVGWTGLVTSLGKATQDFFRISNWHKYIRKAARNAVFGKMVARKLLWKKRNCGSCSQIPLFKPYICGLTGKLVRKGDDPCSDYDPYSPERNEMEDPSVQKKMESDFSSTPEELFMVAELEYKARLALQERVRTARTPGKKQIYLQHAILFDEITELWREGYSEVETKSEILKRPIVGTDLEWTPRKLNRYWNAVREFLRDTVFIDYKDWFSWHEERERRLES